jgi:hypothetical protein
MCITDRSNIKTFDISSNQLKPNGKLDMGFYIVGNSDINQEFIPVQKVRSFDNRIHFIKSSHINHGVLRKTLSFLHN